MSPHQVIDELKRLFHLHMVLADRYVVRRVPGPGHPVPPVRRAVRGPDAAGPRLGQLAAAVDVHFVPGQHHSMVKEPHVEALAQTLAACLRQAEPRTGAGACAARLIPTRNRLGRNPAQSSQTEPFKKASIL